MFTHAEHSSLNSGHFPMPHPGKGKVGSAALFGAVSYRICPTLPAMGPSLTGFRGKPRARKANLPGARRMNARHVSRPSAARANDAPELGVALLERGQGTASAAFLPALLASLLAALGSAFLGALLRALFRGLLPSLFSSCGHA